jgi:hypothetical protein
MAGGLPDLRNGVLDGAVTRGLGGSTHHRRAHLGRRQFVEHLLRKAQVRRFDRVRIRGRRHG